MFRSVFMAVLLPLRGGVAPETLMSFLPKGFSNLRRNSQGIWGLCPTGIQQQYTVMNNWLSLLD